MNLINSESGSITCLSLFPSRRSETRHECVNLLQQSKVFGASALCVICHEVSSPSRFFFTMCNMSLSVLPFMCFCFLATEFFLWRPFCN